MYRFKALKLLQSRLHIYQMYRYMGSNKNLIANCFFLDD